MSCSFVSSRQEDEDHGAAAFVLFFFFPDHTVGQETTQGDAHIDDDNIYRPLVLAHDFLVAHPPCTKGLVLFALFIFYYYYFYLFFLARHHDQ